MKSKDTISQIDLRATETRQFSLGDSACVPQSQQSTPPTLTPCLLAEYIVLRLFDESLTHIALLIRTPEKGHFVMQTADPSDGVLRLLLQIAVQFMQPLAISRSCCLNQIIVTRFRNFDEPLRLRCDLEQAATKFQRYDFVAVTVEE